MWSHRRTETLLTKLHLHWLWALTWDIWLTLSWIFMRWNPIFSNERWLCLVVWEAIISLWVWMSPPSPLGELLLFFFFQIRDMKCMWWPIRYLSADHIQSASIGGFYLWSQGHLSAHIIMLKAQTAFLEACHSPLKILGLFALASGSLTGSPGFYVLHTILPHSPSIVLIWPCCSSWLAPESPGHWERR